MNSPRLTNILLIIIGVLLAVAIFVFYQMWEDTHVKVYEPVSLNTPQNEESNQQQQVVPITTTPTNNTQTSNSGQVQLDLSTEFARNFKTRLTTALNSPPNYGEHYVMVEIGCGSSCISYAAVDKKTGKVFSAPFMYDDGYSIEYTLASDLVTIKDTKGKITYYVLDPTDGFQKPDGMRY